MGKLYTIDEVADYLRVDPRTVRKLIDCGILKKPLHWFYVGKQIRVKEDALKFF